MAFQMFSRRLASMSQRGRNLGKRLVTVMASRSGGMMALSFSLSLAAAPIMAAKTESPAAVRSASHSQGDFNAVRKAIAEILDLPGYDDGSLGPLFVRLAWHASGTYSSFDKTGGSGGGLMRFHPEATDPANNGLNIARDHLEKIKKKFPWISYGDLYTLAGVVAIEEMGGPKITWRPGRADQSSGDKSPKPGRLPDAARNADHIRAVFYRMGFDDREMVALIGAHALGRCHKERSGFDGPWTRAPTTFSNEFFKMLFDEKWTPRKWNGPPQFENQAKDLMMLPADLELIKDSEFRKYAAEYAKDEDKFFKDFAAAFSKLLELGVQFPSTPK